MFKEGFRCISECNVDQIGKSKLLLEKKSKRPQTCVFIGEKGFNLAQSNAILSDRMQTLEKLDINKNRVLSAI